MSRNLAEMMQAFSEGDMSVRVVRGLFSVMPFLPDWRHRGSILQEAARLGGDPSLHARIAARAEAIAQREGPQAALKTLDLLDKADTGLAAFSGIKGVVQSVRGVEGALEMDPQQAADAGMKALGLAFICYKLFDGSTLEKAGALTRYEAGKSLLTWFAAVDVVLPFADNLASGGLELVTAGVDRFAGQSGERLGGGAEVAEAQGVLAAMSGTLKAVIGQAAGFAKPLSDWCKGSLPGVLGAADTATGVAATALDALHTYRYLGSALVLERVLEQAKQEVEAEVAAEAAAAAARKAEEEKKSRTDSYSMSGSSSASSLGSTGIKVTRSSEPAPTPAEPPAKKGCLGCMGLVLAILLLGTASAAWAFF
jgi:hypothetical protein